MALLLISFLVSGQDRLTLSGRVTDSAGGKGIPFAALSLKGCNLGTVSNEEGRFVFTIPAIFSRDTLLASSLGYRPSQCLVDSAIGRELNIVLSPAALQLSEVEIVALTPQEVIRRAVAAIPANYGADSLILTAFVRSQKFARGKLAEYAEAIIEDLKTGYSPYKPREEEARKRNSNVPLLLKGRVRADTSLVEAMGEVERSAGCLGCNFVHDFAEFYRNTVLDESLFPSYDFRMEETGIPGGGKIYHIRFSQKKGVKKRLWTGEIYINAADFALLSVSQKPDYEAFETYEKEKYRKTWYIDGLAGWVAEMPIMEWTVTYSKRNGFYGLSTIRIANRLTFTHPSRQGTVVISNRNDVVVTDITRDPARLKSFKGDKREGVNQRWDQVIGKGDEAFWAGYNYLPVEERLRQDLEGIR